MANLVQRLRAGRDLERQNPWPTVTFDQLPMWLGQFGYQGLGYGPALIQTYQANREAISADFMGFVKGAYKSNGPVFALMAFRMLMFSEARFQFRRMVNGRPGQMFGTPALAPLEHPWQNGTTGDLLSRAITDVDIAGNFYATRVAGPRRGQVRIVRLRPDWMVIVLGSMEDTSVATYDPTAELIGYIYNRGGPGSGLTPHLYLPDEVMHFAPYVDPTAHYRGVSWLEPVLQEVLGDRAMNAHKLQFFNNGASPNLVVSMETGKMDRKTFLEWIKLFESEHEGVANAYKTLYLGQGAQATVVGSDLKQMDFKVVQGAGETRLAAAAGVPPVLVGFSEGLASATYCMPADELVWTGKGPRPISEIETGDQVWSWVNDRPALRPVTWQGQTGVEHVYTLRTKNREFRATGNHPVLMPDGSWRRLDSLQAGDRVLEPLGLPDQARVELPDGGLATREVMQWLGAMIGDGSITDGYDIRMSIPKQDRVREHYAAIPPRLFTKALNGAYLAPGRRAKDGLTPEMVRLRAQGMTFREIRDRMGLSLHPMSIRDRVRIATRAYREPSEPVRVAPCRNGFRFNSRTAGRWHQEMGISGDAKTKRVPGWVFELSEKLRLAFLAGVVDTDGSVDRRGALKVQQANRLLVEDLRMLMVTCGIQCSNIAEVRYEAECLPNPGTCDEYRAWTFTVSSAVEVARIPFADPVYRERVEVNQHRHRPNTIGFRIRSIVRSQDAMPVYDIEVNEGHSFLASGIVVHNSNYAMARRRVADMTFRPLWRNFCGSMATLIDAPGGSELWYDDRDIPFLQEDVKDEADIALTRATALKMLTDAGYTGDSAVLAVETNDFSQLEHSGLYSVQLLPPGHAANANGSGNGNGNGKGPPHGGGTGPNNPAQQPSTLTNGAGPNTPSTGGGGSGSEGSGSGASSARLPPAVERARLAGNAEDLARAIFDARARQEISPDD